MDDRERYIVDLERELTELRVELARLKGAPPPRRSRPRRHADQTRFGRAVRKAAARGKTWELPRETYEALVEEPCEYCGAPTGAGVGLDRLDNSRGYEPGNVVPCCGPCNLLRGNRLTPEETRRAARALQPDAHQP